MSGVFDVQPVNVGQVVSRVFLISTLMAFYCMTMLNSIRRRHQTLGRLEFSMIFKCFHLYKSKKYSALYRLVFAPIHRLSASYQKIVLVPLNHGVLELSNNSLLSIDYCQQSRSS